MKITTTHPQNSELSKHLTQSKQSLVDLPLYVSIVNPNSSFDSQSIIHAPSKATDMDRNQDGELEFHLGGALIKIFNQEGEYVIEFSMGKKHESAISVIGSLDVREVTNPYLQAMHVLEELHNQDDSLEVSVTVSAIKQERGPYSFLYEWVAGHLAQPTGGDFEILKKRTVYCKNDELHYMVVDYWDQSFLPSLEKHVGENVKEKWCKNRTSFMITHKAPIFTKNDKIKLEWIDPDWSGYSDKRVCAFNHPESLGFCIEVREPASPMVSNHVAYGLARSGGDVSSSHSLNAITTESSKMVSFYRRTINRFLRLYCRKCDLLFIETEMSEIQ